MLTKMPGESTCAVWAHQAGVVKVITLRFCWLFSSAAVSVLTVSVVSLSALSTPSFLVAGGFFVHSGIALMTPCMEHQSCSLRRMPTIVG